VIKLKDIIEGSVTGNIRGVKGYTAFIKPSQWDSKRKSLEKSVSNSTGYIMVGKKELVRPSDDTYKSWKRPDMLKMKPLLTEIVDYRVIASKIVDSYGLNSKVNFKSGATKGDYNWKKDIINLRPKYSTIKEFIMTILHEIDHALDRKKYGSKKYQIMYQKAGDVAANMGKDFHDDNKFEEKAELFATKNVSKWMKKIK
jgi:hypothetical protein|tara:strand:+ start:553 stop:1149 length:597 start_codon:yes stop_codon:yes gene_type:complete